MSQAAAIAGNGQLKSAYREYNNRVLARGLMVGNWLSVFGVPGGFVLDYFLYPDKSLQFLAIRMGVVGFLLLAIGFLYIHRDRPNLLQTKILGVLSALSMTLAFCMMIFITDGPGSPYYAGVNLIITCYAVLLPWTVVETGVMCLISLLGYVVACMTNPAFANSSSYPLFAFNIFFILITTAVCIAITFFLSRARFQDFSLRHQLDVQNRELQDLDRLKTQFFSNISHELRTPLTLILGPVETMLSRAGSLDAKTHEGLILIHRNALRLLKLINDLLDLTRLDQGADVLRKKSISLGAYIRGIVESIRHLGLSKQLRIKVEAGDPNIETVADPARIEKVLINLLTNAIKYTPSGGTITVRWSGTAEETVIEVQDTGVGIPAEDLPRIFDRFHQVRGNEANRNQGVGIGLALAKELVEQHGGNLEVESVVGQGTIFRIRLPLEAAPAEPVGQIREVENLDEPFAKAFRSADRSWRSGGDVLQEDLPIVGEGGYVVLVADDEEDMRRYVVSLLSEDYRVVQTSHGANVTDLVAEHEPDLVLLDWMMPGKDGLTVCRELRSNDANHDLKVLLLTARIDEESKITALRSGADDFLTKPFSSIEVKTRVSNLLRAGRLQKDLRNRNDELSGTIHKLHETEGKLVQSEKMNAIGSLSAGLLHEINNPLNYTLTAISFASQFKDSLGPEMKEILADVEEGMKRIRDVITDLKNFAYPEKPGTESVFSIEEVLQPARKIAAGEIENVTVETDLDEGIHLQGQKTQMTHVFINLLSNAGKALKENGVKSPRIIIRAKLAGDRTLIEVGDNGPGIPPEIITRVFEPFFTTREVGSGMGMGLSVCHTIVETHQGTITASNRPEGGALFTINLPLAQEALKLC